MPGLKKKCYKSRKPDFVLCYHLSVLPTPPVVHCCNKLAAYLHYRKLWMQHGIYVALQRPRFTLPSVATTERKLLPYIFTFSHNFLLKAWVVIFCGTISPRVFRGPCLTQGGLPFAVRTFLTIAGAIARICSNAKLWN